MNEFFFELNIWFESDYDVEGLKDKFKIEPTEVVKYNDCDDEDKKTAQFFYQTGLYEDYDVEEELYEFISEMHEKTVGIKEILKENKGELYINIVYKKLEDKKEMANITLSREVLEMLGDMGAHFEVCEF